MKKQLRTPRGTTRTLRRQRWLRVRVLVSTDVGTISKPTWKEFCERESNNG